MRRHGGSFGFVILIVVLAIVLLLAARNLRSVAPTALSLTKPAAEGEQGQPDEQETILETPTNTERPVNMPDMRQMKRNTDAHAGQVQDALAGAE